MLALLSSRHQPAANRLHRFHVPLLLRLQILSVAWLERQVTFLLGCERDKLSLALL